MNQIRKFCALIAIAILAACTTVGEQVVTTTPTANEAADPAVAFANANRSSDIGYTEGYFGSGDTRLHYVEAGEGPLVILYHGFPSFWYSWFDQMEALKETHRVVAVDGLGSGLSAKPQNVEPYKLSKLAKQVDDLARHLAGDEKFVLVGHDWGSVLALSFAQAYPERLHRVVGMNAPPLNMFLKYLTGSTEQQQRSSYMVRIKESTVERLQKMGGGKAIAESAYAKLAERQDLSPEEVTLFHNAMTSPETMYAMMNWYRANIPAWDEISEEDMWPSADATIEVPALVIWGEKDRVAVPELVDKLAKSSPNLKFVNLDGLNHWTSMEQPGKATRQILAFLNDDEGKALQRAKAIHRSALVLDAHADIVLPETSKTYLATDGLSKVHPDKLSAGMLDAVVMSVAVPPGPRTPEGDRAARMEADRKLAAVRQLASKNDDLEIARSAKQIDNLHRNGKAALILGFQNARALEGKVESLDRLYAGGVRIFGLNHMGHNDFSDSSRPLFNGETGQYEVTEEHGGLSPLGVAAIRRINQLGGLIDVSQMSKAATLQAVELSATPVIASHSNVRTLSDVSRNLSDQEIDRIAAKGGVIHLAAFGAYLVDLSRPALLAKIRKVRLDAGLPEAYSYPYELYWEIPDPAKRQAFLIAMRDTIGPSSVDRLIDHIDYVVDRVGIDHVGIGSDFNHGGGITGFADASEALNVTIGLVKRGYTDSQIRKIWGGNFLRAFRAANVGSDTGN